MAEEQELLPSEHDPMWEPGGSETLSNFLAAHRPSEGKASNAWIWVRRDRQGDHHRDAERQVEMTVEAVAARLQLEEEVQKIMDDPSIPIRGSKKNGQSKKAHKEALHQPFANKLKNIADKYEERSGKLLFYWDSTVVDYNFAKLARAMVNEDGAFYSLPVHCLKVSSQPNAPGAPRVVCLYLENSWDKESVKKTWHALMTKVGLMSRSFKADIYTLAGINSASGIKSSLWTANDFFTKEEIEAALGEQKGKITKPATEAEEQARGGQDFADSETEDEAPPPKKKKA